MTVKAILLVIFMNNGVVTSTAVIPQKDGDASCNQASEFIEKNTEFKKDSTVKFVCLTNY